MTNTLARLFAPKFPLRFFSIRPKIPDSDIRVVYRSNRYVSKAARALIDCMKKEGKELTTLNDAAETA
ncbi:MAG: LysR family transcriptional regulator [Sutterella sp.]|nr:LysR family transcriptional regulator [Sutterella sp.]